MQVTHTGCCAGRRLSDVMVGTGALEADGPGSKAQVFCLLAAWLLRVCVVGGDMAGGRQFKEEHHATVPTSG